MNSRRVLLTITASILAVVVLSAGALAASTAQVGASGKTFASSTVSCATNPATGLLAPVIDAGLYQPKPNTKATVSLNGSVVATVTTDSPSATVWLATGANTVVVALSRKTADSYAYTVAPGLCQPDTSGNTFSPDGTLEYGASGKSYATVTPGCAVNPLSGVPQPYVHLFDNGTWVLNVSLNGLPLTQLSVRNTHTPVFLGAGTNVISVASGTVSTDYYIRNGGDGTCVLP